MKVVSTDAFWRETFSDRIWRRGDLGHHAEVWGGNSRSQVLCMRKHAFHICWVWCVEQSWDQRLQNAESGKVDRQREDQRSKQEQMNLCYDSTGWKSCTQSELGLATNAEIWAKALHGLALVCREQDELHCFVLFASDPAYFPGDLLAKSCSSLTLTERKMKSASLLHQQLSGRCPVLCNSRKTDLQRKLTCWSMERLLSR